MCESFTIFFKQRVGYFFRLNANTAKIKLVKAHANINASYTVTATPPSFQGTPPPLFSSIVPLLYHKTEHMFVYFLLKKRVETFELDQIRLNDG